MSTHAATSEQPLRFLDTLVRVHLSHEQGVDGVSVLESRAPYGDAPPLHVHRTQDETFFVVAGELRLEVGGDEVLLRAGDCVCAPRGVPHGYRVESPDGARWLVITSGGDFERFVRAVSRPAATADLPERSAPPAPEEAAALGAVAAAHGIDLVGPPIK